MCTMIARTTAVDGSGKGTGGWFAISQATVGFDHATHAPVEHALLLDFANPSLGLGARVAVELSLESGRALLAQLQDVIAAAEASGVEKHSGSLAGHLEITAVFPEKTVTLTLPREESARLDH